MLQQYVLHFSMILHTVEYGMYSYLDADRGLRLLAVYENRVWK